MRFTSRLVRAFPAILFALAALGAPASAQAVSGVTLSGTVKNEMGAPLAQANVVLTGVRRASTRTDAKGAFSFGGVTPGVYAISVSSAGYAPAGIDSLSVASSDVTVQITATRATLSSVREIAHVTANGRNGFNSSAAPQIFVSGTQLQLAGPSQVNHVLDEIPGIVSARSGSMNAAVPGSLTSPNMRGALDYEKATLVDGHSMINGTRGDYPIMFINGFLLDGIEVQQGPSANSPQINYAIGGTLNFRTLNPTSTPVRDVLFGLDSWGGRYSNFRASGSTANRRLGYVFDYTTYGTPGALSDYQARVALPAGSIIAGLGTVGGTTSGTPLNGQNGPYPVHGALGNPGNAYVTLVACCQTVNSSFLSRGELAKLRYAFSGTTYATVSYYGLQSAYDNTASSFAQLTSIFAPAAGYAGSLAPGSSLLLNSATQIPSRTLVDNEPMLQAELGSAIGNDSVLARFYGAALDRFTVNPVSNPQSAYATAPLTLYGTATVGGTAQTFNGGQYAVTIPNAYFNSSELDQLRGESLQYQHPIGHNLLSFSFDRTTYLTESSTVTGSATKPKGNVSYLAPPGSRQDFSTYLLRGQWQMNPRTQLVLSNYFNVYQSRYTYARNADSTYAFASATRTHDDPRLGLTYHANPDLSLRFEAGSAVAPPFSALLDVVSQTPAQVYTPGSTSVTIAQNAGGLQPETSFGYNLGMDWRTRSGAILSTDVYLTNLHNQFVSSVSAAGTYTPPGGSPIPLYVSRNVNLGQARFEGIDAVLRSDPARGLGYMLSGALQKAFPYNIDPSFYATGAGPYTTNLGVVPGINFVGFNPPFFNGISNKSEAYAQGFGQLHERGSQGQYASLSLTYYGPNNTYNVAPFFIAAAAYQLNVAPQLSLQFSADNLFGTNSGAYITTAAGSTAPLVNGSFGLRNAVPYGPTAVHVQLERRFGP